MGNAVKRSALAGLAVLALTGCVPTFGSDIATPGTPLAYGWVMAHHYQDWGVQIGPKVDAGGTHVAVYAWIACYPTCKYEFFHEYDALPAGSIHRYAANWNGSGWELIYDGRVMATMNLGSPSTAIYETNYGERTSS